MKRRRHDYKVDETERYEIINEYLNGSSVERIAKKHMLDNLQVIRLIDYKIETNLDIIVVSQIMQARFDEIEKIIDCDFMNEVYESVRENVISHFLKLLTRRTSDIREEPIDNRDNIIREVLDTKKLNSYNDKSENNKYMDIITYSLIFDLSTNIVEKVLCSTKNINKSYVRMVRLLRDAASS